MPNWNGVPIPEPSQIKIPNSIPQNFNWNSYVSDPTGTFNRFKGAREVNRVNWKGYRTAAANTKKAILSSPSKRVLNAAMKQVRSLRKARKVADNAKKVQDAFFKKMPGGANPKNGGIAGGHLLNIVLQGGLALAVIQNTLIQDFINNRVDDQFTTLNNDLSKNLSVITTLNSKVQNLNKKVDDFNVKISKELDANAKDFAKLNKQTETIGQQVTAAKKQANDALYETREGRKIVTGLAESARKLANDTLYEFRANKIAVESKITEQRISFDAKIQSINAQISKFNNTVGDTFQRSVNATISKLQSDLAATRSQLSAIKPDTASITANAVAAAKAEVNALKSVISGLTTQINAAMQLGSTAISSVGNLAQGVSSANSTANQALGEVKSSAAKNLGTMQQQLDAKFNEVVAQNAKDLKIRDLSQSNLSKEFDQKLADFERLNKLTGDERYQALIEDNRKTLGGVDLKLSKLSQEFDKHFEDFKQQSTKTSEQLYEEFIAKNKADLASVKSDVVTVQRDIKGNQSEITKLDTKLKEQEKVNSAALPKLDQILGFLPLIPARAADAIRPDIPTIPQIENAAATGTCRTTQPGGCMRRALDDNAANIINNNNTNAANLLNAYNAGANTALLQGQATILERLGAQLPGGIGGKLTRFTQWLQLDTHQNYRSRPRSLRLTLWGFTLVIFRLLVMGLSVRLNLPNIL